MLNFSELAQRHSAQCFLNSYIRDIKSDYHEELQAFIIKQDTATLVIPVTQYSSVGVHQYSDQFLLKENGKTTLLDFMSLAKILTADAPQLYSRLQNSLHNMTLSLKERQEELSNLYSGQLNFLNAEQGLHIGHSFHPTPKSRDEFTDADLESYAPEFGATFSLCWFFVKKEILWEERSHSFNNIDWGNSLYPYQPPHGFIPFPCHPWQKNIWIKDPELKVYFDNGDIREAPEHKTMWFATSSMRSLYQPHNPFMIKFSMSVRLTNSIRHLQPTEVARGMQVQDAFETPSGKEFSQRFPQFQVMHEPLCAAIKSQQGEILPQTMILLRTNPFLEDNCQSVVLATLTQENPLGGKNLISTCLSLGHTGIEWFNAFLDNAITPLLIAQADYGIMLGAHQQNLLLKLQNGLTIGAYFRDCQGTGFSQLGETILANDMPQVMKFRSHLVPYEASRSLFSYYLIVNSVLNTIAATARASNEDESIFIDLFKNYLSLLSKNVKDPSILKHLLNSPTLDQKGNFRCSFQGLNENTAENPLSLYNSFPNPFYMESTI